MTIKSIVNRILGTETKEIIPVSLVDYHCHILPGVDDGVDSTDEALAILDEYSKLGFKEMWLTPHIMEDIPNEPSFLRERFAELTKAYSGDIKLHLASENMIDELFVSRLEENNLLPIRDRLLMETSFYAAPTGMTDILESVIQKGYIPMLAHPERYNYMKQDDYKRLKEMKVEFQLNIMSLSGRYGPAVKEKALWLAENGMYSYTGTDIHSFNRIEFVDKALHNRKAREVIYTLNSPGIQETDTLN